MDLKIISMTVALFAASTCAAQSTNTYSDQVLLKNYALTKCLAQASGAADFKKDADATAAGYLEFGHVDFQAYEDAIALGHTFVAKDYPSKSGQSLNVMKCVDLFHSNELDRLVRKYVKARR